MRLLTVYDKFRSQDSKLHIEKSINPQPTISQESSAEKVNDDTAESVSHNSKYNVEYNGTINNGFYKI